ncbi:cell division protein FtsQ/DivIB, partial [Brachybacterium hainanense]
PATGEGRVVPAADRFRALVSPRPWLRRRRALLATAGGLVGLAALALGVLLLAPPFQVSQIQVTGTGYVDAAAVEEAAAPALGGSILTVPRAEIGAAAGTIPGVRSVEVERSWPDGVRVRVAERTPIASVTAADGTTAILDGEGVELPAAAAEGASLTPLVVETGSGDPEGATEAMIEVLDRMPPDLRGATSSVTASTRSDVTLVLSLEEGEKTVVWGDVQDSELKSQVVAALLDQPGTVIDVSSPVAPVTR